jgi:NAD(P)H-dependent FMN reductase
MKRDFSELRIVVLSSSPSEASRSRLAALYARKCLTDAGVPTDFLDLRAEPVALYPGRPDDLPRVELVRRFHAADGWVIAGPVYNYGAGSVLINFLHYALNSEGRRHRPFVLIAGAGGEHSFLAFDSLANRLAHEIHAVPAVPTVYVAGEAANPAEGHLDSKVRQRLHVATSFLLYLTEAAREFTREQELVVQAPETPFPDQEGG